MREKQTNILRPPEFFVVRTPLLPFSGLAEWGQGTELKTVADPSATDQVFKDAWRNDLNLLRERLRTWIEAPEVKHALGVASSSLLPGLDHWKKSPDSKKGLQAERSVVRYLSRMCGRSTPFGLFSGCSLGVFEPEASHSELSFAALRSNRIYPRLDFDYLFALTAALAKDSRIAEGLIFVPNSSLHKFGKMWHYVESRLARASRTHHLVRLESDVFLEAVVDYCSGGARLSAIRKALLSLPEANDITLEEAAEYVQQLVDSEVLVCSLRPLVTGKAPVDDLLKQLADIPEAAEIAAQLQICEQHLQSIREEGVGAGTEHYKAAEAAVRNLPGEVQDGRAFQVDMIKPTVRAVLGSAIAKQLEQCVRVLLALGNMGEAEDLRNFRQAFSSRYGRSWMPLLEVLDEEIGIGFGRTTGADSAPLLRGLHLTAGTPVPQNPAREKLAREISARISQGGGEIVLEAADINVSEDQLQSFPDAFDLQFNIAASSPEALRKGEFHLYLKGGSGPSGARLLGRFCHVDAELNRFVKRHIVAEEAHEQDAILAEVVYLPEGRIGNVLCRPEMREYEIVYLGRSGAPIEKQIPASDLLISVAGSGEIVLFSRRLQRRIIPRLSTAHSFMNPKLSSVYRLLCSLQHQNGKGVPGFNWSTFGAGSAKYTPRLRVGCIVLTPATWRLSEEEIENLKETEREQAFCEVQALRRRLGMPRWVVLSEADNLLPCDLDNLLSVDALVHVMKRSPKGAIIQELYPAPEDLCATSPEGSFYHEVIVPVVRLPRPETADHVLAKKSIEAAIASARYNVPLALRNRTIGSDWLFFKIYGGVATTDRILRQDLPPILQRAFSWKLIDRWFYIRYTDPENHIRLRLHGRPDRLLSELLPLVEGSLRPLLESGHIWKLQLDTYEREMERYGGPAAMDIAEDIFFADSEAVLRILSQMEITDADEAFRWQIAAVGIDRLLNDFDLDLDQRRGIMQRLRDGFGREFGLGTDLKKQLGDKFRTERQRLEAMLGADLQKAGSFVEEAFTLRSQKIKGLWPQIKALESTADLTGTAEDLIPNYLHMFANRFMRTSQRAHELVLYDFLTRVYETRIMMNKRKASKLPELQEAQT